METPLHEPGLPGNALALPARTFPRVLAMLSGGRSIRPVGMEARTLLLLVKRGALGLRASDFPEGLPYRLSGHIHDLRRMGVCIRTDREKHATGLHAVYVLEEPIIIEAVNHGAQMLGGAHE